MREREREGEREGGRERETEAENTSTFFLDLVSNGVYINLVETISYLHFWRCVCDSCVVALGRRKQRQTCRQKDRDRDRQTETENTSMFFLDLVSNGVDINLVETVSYLHFWRCAWDSCGVALGRRKQRQTCRQKDKQRQTNRGREYLNVLP